MVGSPSVDSELACLRPARGVAGSSARTCRFRGSRAGVGSTGAPRIAGAVRQGVTSSSDGAQTSTGSSAAGGGSGVLLAGERSGDGGASGSSATGTVIETSSSTVGGLEEDSEYRGAGSSAGTSMLGGSLTASTGSGTKLGSERSGG